MDGASIHCDPNITRYLRSLGIQVIVLPAYCPFFNPIELMFHSVKSRMRRLYIEHADIPTIDLVLQVLSSFLGSFDSSGNFRKCGYYNGYFNPERGLQCDCTKLGFIDYSNTE
jgi:transposase